MPELLKSIKTYNDDSPPREPFILPGPIYNPQLLSPMFSSPTVFGSSTGHIYEVVGDKAFEVAPFSTSRRYEFDLTYSVCATLIKFLNEMLDSMDNTETSRHNKNIKFYATSMHIALHKLQKKYIQGTKKDIEYIEQLMCDMNIKIQIS